ncbi:hypothetical protein BV25DRAFT_1790701, partial [Artomyces pyxidatus]
FVPSLGACGLTSTSTDLIVAAAAQVFDTLLRTVSRVFAVPVCLGLTCARQPMARLKATIVDRCVACVGPDDLDFSPAAFSVLASVDLGRVPVAW